MVQQAQHLRVHSPNARTHHLAPKYCPPTVLTTKALGLGNTEHNVGNDTLDLPTLVAHERRQSSPMRFLTPIGSTTHRSCSRTATPSSATQSKPDPFTGTKPLRAGRFTPRSQEELALEQTKPQLEEKHALYDGTRKRLHVKERQ